MAIDVAKLVASVTGGKDTSTSSGVKVSKGSTATAKSSSGK